MHLKQKEIFEELANNRVEEIQDLVNKLTLIIQLIIIRVIMIQIFYKVH